MTPPLACLPVCTFFSGLALLGFAALALGAGRTDPKGAAAAADGRPANLPAWWVVPLIVVALAAVTGLLAWSTWDY